MTADRQVTAVFAKTSVRLTVTKRGSGTVSGMGFVCGPRCFDDVTPRIPVTLSARPASGWYFDRWLDGAAACGATPTCTLRMDGPVTATAVFVGCRQTLQLEISGDMLNPPEGIPCLRWSHTVDFKGAPAWPGHVPAKLPGLHRCVYSAPWRNALAVAAYDEVSPAAADKRRDASTYARCMRDVPDGAKAPTTLVALYGYTAARGRPHWGLHGHLPKSHRAGRATDFVKIFRGRNRVLDPTARRLWHATAMRSSYAPMLNVSATGSTAAQVAAAVGAMCAGGPNGVPYEDGRGYLGLWSGSVRGSANAEAVYAALSACTRTFLATG